jgi:hypothetical protein
MVTKEVLVTLLIKSTIVTTATSVTSLRGAISFRTDPEKTLLMLARTSPPGAVCRIISYLEKRYTICDSRATSCQIKVCLVQFAILKFCLGKNVTKLLKWWKQVSKNGQWEGHRCLSNLWSSKAMWPTLKIPKARDALQPTKQRKRGSSEESCRLKQKNNYIWSC